MKAAAELWMSITQPLHEIGAMARFLVQLTRRAPRALVDYALVGEQIYNAGLLTLGIIMLSGLFVGMILALQGAAALQRFGSADALGAVAMFGLLRELSPVVTALLFAGRAGTALATELGLMQATDQLSAMEMMAVDPVQRVVVPRFLGGVVAMPLLAALFSVCGIYGVQLIGVQIMRFDRGPFWSQLRGAVSPADIYEGIVKSCVFGIVCSLIAVYQGYHAEPTAEGVGRATTRTVVTSGIAIFLLDYLISATFL
jgi:phospholipid/cholesterol/gamma-HCH transport system permease protein